MRSGNLTGHIMDLSSRSCNQLHNKLLHFFLYMISGNQSANISLVVAPRGLHWARKRPAIRRLPETLRWPPSLRITIGSRSWPLFSLFCEATLPTVLKASPSTSFPSNPTLSLLPSSPSQLALKLCPRHQTFLFPLHCRRVAAWGGQLTGHLTVTLNLTSYFDRLPFV